MTLEEIGGSPQELGHGKYGLLTVPKPHSAFEAYVVQVTPTFGLSWIKAIGRDIQTDAFGTRLQYAFDNFEKKLTSTYGAGKIIDGVIPESIWSEPKDWMMSLLKGERVLGKLWSEDYGSSLPDWLTNIVFCAYAREENIAYLALEYTFTNNEAAEAELTEAEDEAL